MAGQQKGWKRRHPCSPSHGRGGVVIFYMFSINKACLNIRKAKQSATRETFCLHHIFRPNRPNPFSTNPQIPHMNDFLSLPLSIPLSTQPELPVSTSLALGLKVCDFQTLELKIHHLDLLGRCRDKSRPLGGVFALG